MKNLTFLRGGGEKRGEGRGRGRGKGLQEARGPPFINIKSQLSKVNISKCCVLNYRKISP